MYLAAIDKAEIRSAIMELNSWHPNIPLLLVFSMQGKNIEEVLDGGASAVRSTYDALFSLQKIGIADDAKKYYLHFCHQAKSEMPYAIRKPSANYGKTHQRILKDTFGQQFLKRQGAGKYTLTPDFAKDVFEYFALQEKIDLRPLVLFHYWNDLEDASTVSDLWARFCEQFKTDSKPYDEIFQCSSLEQEIPKVDEEEFKLSDMKQIVLPTEYGVGSFNADFWRFFRNQLEQKLKALRWQGDINSLSSRVTAGLMQDQSLFLVGDPGTGKTTLVLEAILPALRQAIGSNQEVILSHHTVTPSTSSSDLLGFQGLDGSWIEGPLTKEVLMTYSPEQSALDQLNGDDAVEEKPAPILLFLDEANRVDVEELLAPLQPAFDRLQKRMEPPTVKLGANEYIMPPRTWRIFAGNSPAADTGRRQQSRPFKRRLSVVSPPNPLEIAVAREDSFRKLCFDLLSKAADLDDPEVSEPCLALLGKYTDNPGRIEDLRLLLIQLSALPRVSSTIGLVESILLRAAAYSALQPEGALDAAVQASLISLITGDSALVEEVADTASRLGFPDFATAIRSSLSKAADGLSMDVEPIL